MLWSVEHSHARVVITVVIIGVVGSVVIVLELVIGTEATVLQVLRIDLE